jgi:ABC-2 type transport system permease protein
MANDFLNDVWYMFTRSFKKFLRSPMLFILSLVTPIMFLVVFTQAFSSIGNFPGFPSSGYLDFAVAGIILMMAFSAAMQSGSAIIEDFDSEFLSKLLVTPVSRPAILLGRLLSDAVRIVLQTSVVLVLAYLMGATFITGIPGLLVILLMMALFAIAWSGFSLALGLASKSAETVTGLSMFLTFPLTFISTAFMPLALLPVWMQTLANVNPISYSSNALRALTITGFEWGTILWSVVVLLVIALLSIGVTMHLFKKMMR